MKLTRCMHNHYYDGNKFSVCPECVAKGRLPAPASGMPGKRVEESCPQAAPVLEIEKASHSLHPTFEPDIAKGAALDTKTTDFINGFWPVDTSVQQVKLVNTDKQKEKQADPAQEAIEQEKITQEEIKREEIKQEEIKQEEIKQEEIKQEEIKQEEIKQEESVQEENKLVQSTQEELVQEDVTQEEIAQDKHDENVFCEQSEENTDIDTENPPPKKECVQAETLQKDGAQLYLKEAVSSVSKTSAFEDMKTVAFYHTDALNPVVGWLVGLNGEYLGESFPLRTGRNHIGRWAKMDVALMKEPSVSRDRHAILTYDPKSKTYFIQPGEGNGLTYQNEQVLLNPQVLADGDILQLGECKMLFKALCVNDFTWDSYL